MPCPPLAKDPALSTPPRGGDLGDVADESGGFAAPLETSPQASVHSRLSPLADDTDEALAAADEAIDSLLSGSGRKYSWLHPVAEETSDGDAESPDATSEVQAAMRRAAQKSVPRAALFFELTENAESLDDIDDDNIEADFGLSPNALEQIEEQFKTPPRKPQLFYELTEDLGTHDLDASWQDSDFGLADWQLEELWKRFESRVVSGPSATADLGADVSADASVADVQCQPMTLTGRAERQSQGASAACPDAITKAEEAVENIGLTKLHDFLGDHTLEQFIGQKVPPPPPGGISVWMLSTRNVSGEDWYLFKVTDRGVNRFYMKDFSDFEELHAALLNVTPRGRPLPVLPEKDFLGFKRFMLGSEFSSTRTQQLRAYVDELMTQLLTSSQERALRSFFGPTARGEVLPPGGGQAWGEPCAPAQRAGGFGPRPGAAGALRPRR